MSCTNVESYFKHRNQITYYVNKYEPLILCLTETGITEDFDMFELCINGYEISRCDSSSRHTGGVLILTKIGCQICNVKSVMSKQLL